MSFASVGSCAHGDGCVWVPKSVMIHLQKVNWFTPTDNERELTTDSLQAVLEKNTPFNRTALRMNIILKSILSLKHMQHTFSSQAIEEKAKIQGQLLQFNDFIFIRMGAFLKGIVPHHCLKSIQAIWWPPERRINQDSMAASWFWET